MVKATKSATPATTAPVETPIVVPVVVDEAPKSKKAKKAKVVDEPVISEPVVPVMSAPVEEVSAPVDTPFTNATTKLADFGKNIQQLTSIINGLKLEYKVLEKVIAKEIKVVEKYYRRGKKSGSKKPTGFRKPTLIADELATFLKLEKGVEFIRSDVSKQIHEYIKEHKLNKGRDIFPDEPLSKILNYKQGTDVQLNYLNLQKYLKHNFIKAVVVDAPIV